MASEVAALALETLGPLALEVESSRLLETLLTAAEATLSAGWHPRGKPRLALIIAHPRISLSDIRWDKHFGVVERVLHQIPEESALEIGSRTIGFPANEEILRGPLFSTGSHSHICFIGTIAADDMFVEATLQAIPRLLLSCIKVCIVHPGTGSTMVIVSDFFERRQLPKPTAVKLKAPAPAVPMCSNQAVKLDTPDVADPVVPMSTNIQLIQPLYPFQPLVFPVGATCHPRHLL